MQYQDCKILSRAMLFLTLGLCFAEYSHAAPVTYTYQGAALISGHGPLLSPSDSVTGFVTYATPALPGQVDKDDILDWQFNAGPLVLSDDIAVFNRVIELFFDANGDVNSWNVAIETEGTLASERNNFISNSSNDQLAIGDDFTGPFTLGTDGNDENDTWRFNSSAGIWTATIPEPASGIIVLASVSVLILRRHQPKDAA